MLGSNGALGKESSALRTIGPDELRRCFPNLVSGTYDSVSKATARYNCMAFANDDERHWWEPGRYGGRYYWPIGIKQQDTLEAWLELFIAQGYEQVESREIETGYEKIAIFVDLEDMMPSHVAKSDGRIWKSKLGKGQDI